MINLLEILKTTFLHVESIIGSVPFLLTITTIAISLKAFILSILIKQGIHSKKIQGHFLILLLVLIGSTVVDASWILKLLHMFFFPTSDYRLIKCFIRIAWAFYVLQYQSLAIFTVKLADKKKSLNLYHKIFISISGIIATYFIILAILGFNHITPRTPIESKILTITSFYLISLLIWTSLSVVIWKVRSRNMPRILKRQLKILIQFIICPLLIADFIAIYPGFISTTVTNAYAMIGFSTLMVTYATFHCMRKIMGLRFLNFQNHVQAPKKFSFIHDFKNILDQFSQVTSTRELGHITQTFFKDAFNIPSRRTRLIIRNLDTNKDYDNPPMLSRDEEIVENFINPLTHEKGSGKFLVKHKVIITDELEFSNFYEEDESREQILTFMKSISADIFIPILEKNVAVAYIVIERYARINSENKNADFYSNLERDQMVVFANYLGNILKLLKSKNLNSLIRQEKELKEELYSKHQEINQYKESIRSFFKNTQHKKIGIIFYKNRKFTFGNQTARELIHVRLNTHDGHPTTKKIKRLANQVLEYKSPQTCFIQDDKGEKLVVSGIPNIENNNAILIVYYPEISDILKLKIDLLKDPTKWDYLLYLETTKSGKLINQLIPGNGETLLNFKLDLLKTALSKKAILLDIPDQDLVPTVEILHHISLRETLHILDLQKPSKTFETAVKLFGINPIFGMSKDEKPILEKLHEIGTLFIKNIHLLELETQKYLADFIRYGFFRKFKGDQKTFSNVRIICSTSVNLQKEVQEGKFAKELFNELNKTSITMPSLMTLSEDELDNLTTGFTEQAIKADELQHVLELTDAEKKKISRSRPTSFQELKAKIQQLLIKKSKQHSIYEEAQFDPAYDISDPELVEAIRLGKHSLKDKKIMTMLWNKFKNQNKIANMLGVNRSSVNRRCKDYNLL